jgi:hypothetical protein
MSEGDYRDVWRAYLARLGDQVAPILPVNLHRVAVAATGGDWSLVDEAFWSLVFGDLGDADAFGLGDIPDPTPDQWQRYRDEVGDQVAEVDHVDEHADADAAQTRYAGR